jgi:hypothetical protein
MSLAAGSNVANVVPQASFVRALCQCGDQGQLMALTMKLECLRLSVTYVDGLSD